MTAQRKSHVRAVAADEVAPKPKRYTVETAADEGTHRDLLVAMRSRVAKAVGDPNTPARDLASLTRRLHEIVREIDAIDAAALEEDSSDATPDEEWDESAI